MDKHIELVEIELIEKQMEAFAEAITKIVIVFVEVYPVIQKVVKGALSRVDQIKEFIDNHNTKTDTRPERKGWRIPRKIIKDHQVFDRRPRVVYIRGEI